MPKNTNRRPAIVLAFRRKPDTQTSSPAALRLASALDQLQRVDPSAAIALSALIAGAVERLIGGEVV